MEGGRGNLRARVLPRVRIRVCVLTRRGPLFQRPKSEVQQLVKRLRQVVQCKADQAAAGSHSLSHPPLQAALQEAVSEL